MSLCKYKDIFGKVNTGIHSYRFFGLAFFDIFFTLLGALLIQKYYYQEYKWYFVFFILLVLGEIFHLLFCVKTPITSLITN